MKKHQMANFASKIFISGLLTLLGYWGLSFWKLLAVLAICAAIYGLALYEGKVGG